MHRFCRHLVDDRCYIRIHHLELHREEKKFECIKEKTTSPNSEKKTTAKDRRVSLWTVKFFTP